MAEFYNLLQPDVGNSLSSRSSFFGFKKRDYRSLNDLFCDFCINRGYVPDNHLEVRNAVWDQLGELVGNNPEAFQKYMLKLTNEKDVSTVLNNLKQHKYMTKENKFLNILNKSFNSLFFKYSNFDVIKSMGVVNGDVHFGTSKSDIRKVISPDESWLISQIPAPATKIVSIPKEIYDDGVMSKVKQNRKRRAYFSQKQKSQKAMRLAA